MTEPEKPVGHALQPTGLNASRMMTFVLSFQYKGNLPQRVEATPGQPPQTAIDLAPPPPSPSSYPKSENRTNLRKVFALLLPHPELPRDGLQSLYPPFQRLRKNRLALCLWPREASQGAPLLQALQRTGTGDSGHSVQFRAINQEAVSD